MTDTEPVTDLEFQTLARFRHHLRHFLHFSEQAARTAGLTPQQYQALLAIRGAAKSPTVGELADTLFIQPHSAAGLVDRLEKQGLITRQTDRQDRRRVLVGLTDQSRQILRSLSAVHRDELRRLSPQLRELLSTLTPTDSD